MNEVKIRKFIVATTFLAQIVPTARGALPYSNKTVSVFLDAQGIKTTRNQVNGLLKRMGLSMDLSQSERRYLLKVLQSERVQNAEAVDWCRGKAILPDQIFDTPVEPQKHDYHRIPVLVQARSIIRDFCRSEVYTSLSEAIPTFGAVETLERSASLLAEPMDAEAINWRVQCVREWRNRAEGAEIKGLQSADMANEVHSAPSGYTPSDWKIDCMKWRNQMRQGFAELAFALDHNTALVTYRMIDPTASSEFLDALLVQEKVALQSLGTPPVRLQILTDVIALTDRLIDHDRFTAIWGDRIEAKSQPQSASGAA